MDSVQVSSPVGSDGTTVTLVVEKIGNESHEDLVQRALKSAGQAGLVTAATEPPKEETVQWVVRRDHDNDDNTVTPVMDVYREWNAARTAPAFAFTSIYLNTDEDREKFETRTGLQIDNLPIYSGQGALQRKPEKVTKYEVQIPTPIRVRKVYRGDKEINGKTVQTYRFDSYIQGFS